MGNAIGDSNFLEDDVVNAIHQKTPYPKNSLKRCPKGSELCTEYHVVHNIEGLTVCKKCMPISSPWFMDWITTFNILDIAQDDSDVFKIEHYKPLG